MTQTDQIRAHLESGKTITPLEALDLFRCFRLAARIAELKEAGFPVEAHRIKTPSGARVCRYRKASA